MPFLFITQDNGDNDDQERWWFSKAKTIEEARAEAKKHVLDERFGEDRNRYIPGLWDDPLYLDSMEIIEFTGREEVDVFGLIDEDMARFNREKK